MKINLDNLKCRVCQAPLPNPGYRLTRVQAVNRLCMIHRAEISRRCGRVPMDQNAAIIITPSMEQVIIGSILGDGYLAPPPKGSVNWGLDIKHGTPQKDYALHKAKLLGNLVSKVDYPIGIGSFEDPFAITDRVRIRTKRHPYLSAWAESVCPFGSKIVPMNLIDAIGPQALAVWYMDDGSLHVGHPKSGDRTLLIRISSFSFTRDENASLCDMLRVRFGIEAVEWKVYNHNEKTKHATPHYYGIKIRGASAETFLNITRPFAEMACMAYKWGLHPIPTA